MAIEQERAALNEAVARDVNEGIEAAHEEAGREGYVRIVCECGRDDCDSVLAMTLEEYERVRSDPRHFAVAQGHVLPGIEDLAEDRGRFVVVCKREGPPAEIAEETDPRDVAG
ncbi:MAG: hypothetical protein NVSMB32_05250 [Actinomycetota bacterium]